MTVQHVKEHKSELPGRLRKYVDEAPRSFSRVSRNLERFARSRPLIASIAALTAGFLIARVLTRG